MKKSKALLVTLALVACCGFASCNVLFDDNSSSVESPSSESSSSSQAEATQLLAPVIDLDYDNGISWAAVENASGYVVNVNGEDMEMQAGTYFEAIAGPGTYEVKVKAVGDGVLYTDSEYSSVETYTVEQKFTVEKFQSVAYTVLGANQVVKGEDYTFTVAVSELYEGDYTVEVNGQAISATEGVYVVENVSEDLLIQVKGLSLRKVAVTVDEVEGVTFIGETSVSITTDYTFKATVEDGYRLLTYVNGKRWSGDEDGNYVVKNITEELSISFKRYSEDDLFITDSTANMIEKDVYQAHAEEGCDGVTGLKLVAGTTTVESFEYTNPVQLNEGENVIAKFMTTNPIVSTWDQGGFEVKSVTFVLTDAAGNELKITLTNSRDQGAEVNTANAWVSVLYNGDSLGGGVDGYSTNFSNRTHGEKVAYKAVPEVKFDSTAGTVTYGSKSVTNAALVGFGTSGDVCVHIDVLANKAGYGIVLDTFMNKDLYADPTANWSTTVSKINKDGEESSMSLDAALISGTQVIGKTVDVTEVAQNNVPDGYYLDVYKSVLSGTVTEEGLTLKIVYVEIVTADWIVTVTKVDANGNQEDITDSWTDVSGTKQAGETVDVTEVAQNNVPEGYYLDAKNSVLSGTVTEAGLKLVVIYKVGFYATSTGTVTENVTQAHAEAGCEGLTGTQLMPTKVSGENFVYSEILKLQEGDNVLAKFIAAGNVNSFKLGITYFNFVDVETGATLQVQIHPMKEWSQDVPSAFVAFIYTDKDGNSLFVNGNSNGRYINLTDGYASNYQNKTMGEAVAYKKTPEITLNTTTGTISWCGVEGTTKTEESLKNFGLNGVKVTVTYYNEWYTPRGGIVVDTLCNREMVTKYSVTKTSGEGYTIEGAEKVAAGRDYTFRVNVASGYEGTPEVKVNDETVTANDNGIYTVSGVNANLTITVSGITKKTVFNVTATTNDAVTFTGEETVEEGATYTFKATANEGYVLLKVLCNGTAMTADGEGVYTVENVSADLTITFEAPQIVGGFYTTSTGTITANVTQAHAEAGCEGLTGTQLMPTKVNGENFVYSEVLKLQEGDNVLAKFIAAGDVNSFKLGITYFTFEDVESGAKLQVQIHPMKEWSQDVPSAFVAFIYTDKDGNSLFVNGNSNGRYINLTDGYASNYQNKTMGEAVAYKKTPEITLNTTTGTISWCGVEGTTKTEESLKNFGLNGVKVTVTYYNEWYTPRGGIVVDTLCNREMVAKYSVTKTEGEGYTIEGAEKVVSGADYAFKVIVDTSYEGTPVVKVNGNEVTLNEEGVYTVTNVTEDLTITVSGLTLKSVFNVTATTNEAVTFTGEETVEEGATYTFKAVANEGYVLLKVLCNGTALTADASGNYTVENVSTTLEITFETSQIVGGFYATSTGMITANVTQAHAEAGCEGLTGTQLMPTKVSGENFVYSEILKLQEGDNVLAKFIAAGNVNSLKLGITYFTFEDVESGAKLQVQIHPMKEWSQDVPSAFVAFIYTDKDGNSLFVNGNSNGRYINLTDGYASNYQNKTMGEAVAYKKTPEITLNTTTGTISWCGVEGTTKTEESLKNFGLNGVKVTVTYYNEWYTPRGGIVVDTLCNREMVAKYSVTKTEGEGYTIEGAEKVVSGADYAFKVIVDTSYEGTPVVKVNGNEVTLNEEGVYTVTNVTEDLTITVSGLTLKSVFNVTATTNEAVTFTGEETVEEGATYTFKAVANEGYVLNKVYVNGTEVTANAEGVYTVENVQENLTITFDATQTKAHFTALTTGTITENVTQAHAEAGCAGVTGVKLMPTKVNGEVFEYSEVLKLQEGDNVLAKFIAAGDVNSFKLGITYFNFVDVETGATLQVQIHTMKEWGQDIPSAFVSYIYTDKDGNSLFVNGNSNGRYVNLADDYASNYQNKTMGEAVAYKKTPEITLNTTTGTLSWCGVAKTTITEESLKNFGLNGVTVKVQYYNEWYSPRGGIVIDTLCNEDL